MVKVINGILENVEIEERKTIELENEELKKKLIAAQNKLMRLAQALTFYTRNTDDFSQAKTALKEVGL